MKPPRFRARKSAAQRFENEIAGHLADLNMAGTRFRGAPDPAGRRNRYVGQEGSGRAGARGVPDLRQSRGAARGHWRGSLPAARCLA